MLGEVGVYLVQGNKLTAVEPEIVNWRTGGVLKSIATVGLDKGHVNGTVCGPTSRLSLASPPQLTQIGTPTTFTRISMLQLMSQGTGEWMFPEPVSRGVYSLYA